MMRCKRHIAWFLGMSLSLVIPLVGMASAVISTAAAQKTIYGRVEQVKLPQDLVLAARMDTGAQTSSLNAMNIRKITQDGKTFISFDTVDPKTQKVYAYTLPYVETVEIKSRARENSAMNNEDDDKENIPPPVLRYVVKLSLCLGDEQHTVKVNLTDRSHFTYPLLIGRTTMYAFDAVIDPSLRYTQQPTCEKK